MCAARLNKAAFFEAVEQHGTELNSLTDKWQYGAGSDVLTTAASHGSLEVVEWIMARSASVFPPVADMNHLSLLMIAAAHSKRVDVVEAIAASVTARYTGQVTEAALYQSAFSSQMYSVARTCGADVIGHILARLGPLAATVATQGAGGQAALLGAIASADPFAPGVASESVASARAVLSVLTPEAGRSLILSSRCAAVSVAAVARNEQLVHFFLGRLAADESAAADNEGAAADNNDAVAGDASLALSTAGAAALQALDTLLLRDTSADQTAAVGTAAHAATRAVLDLLLLAVVGAPLDQTLRSAPLLRQVWARVMAPHAGVGSAVRLAVARARKPDGLVLTESETARALRIAACDQSILTAQLTVAAALAGAPGSLALRLPLWRKIIAGVSMGRRRQPWARWREATEGETVPPTAESCTCSDHRERLVAQQAARAAAAFVQTGSGVRADDDDWADDEADAGGVLASPTAAAAFGLGPEAGAAFCVRDDLARARIVGAILRAAPSDNVRRELMLPLVDETETCSALHGALSNALPVLTSVLLRAGADPLVGPVLNKAPLIAAITATAIELLPDTLHARVGACVALLKRFALALTDDEAAEAAPQATSALQRWADAVGSGNALFVAASAANAPVLRELCGDAEVAPALRSGAAQLVHAMCSAAPYQHLCGAAHVRAAFPVLSAAIRSAFATTAPPGGDADAHADAQWARLLATPTEPSRLSVAINACSYAASRPNAFTTALTLIEAGAECVSAAPAATTTVLHRLLHPGRVMRGDKPNSDISAPLARILRAVRDATELRQRYAELNGTVA